MFSPISKQSTLEKHHKDIKFHRRADRYGSIKQRTEKDNAVTPTRNLERFENHCIPCAINPMPYGDAIRASVPSNAADIPSANNIATFFVYLNVNGGKRLVMEKKF